jgi:hypothetical protein
MALAIVIDVFGGDSDESASHAVGCCADASGSEAKFPIATNTNAAFFMLSLAVVQAETT